MTLILCENTFITLEDANSYFDNRPCSSVWTSLSSCEKEQSLIYATLKVNNLKFIGNKKQSSQSLEFPRDFTPDLPSEIQYAVCEEALAICENSPHLKNKNLGISAISLGTSSVSYFSKSDFDGLLSPEAFAFASKWTEKNFDMY